MSTSICKTPAYGPRPFTSFDLRGIRFFFPPGDENGGGGGGGGGGDEKKFSQEELDAQIEQRLARERKKFEGHDDLKAKAEKWDSYEAEKAKKTPSKDDKRTNDDEKPSGPSDEDVQKRIDDALKAERVRSGSKLVSLELDKALADRVVEPSKLLGFDRTEFVTAEGDVDKQKLADWVKENTTESQAPRIRRDPSQGKRDSSANGGSVQSGRDEWEKRHGKKQ